MLEDLMLLTNEIKSLTHEVLLLVDVNEAFISSECGLSKFTQSTHMTDPIFNKHGSHLEPNIHKNDVSRIDYVFFTPHLEKFILRCGISTFDLFTSSDHRGLYLDINILVYLKDSSTSPPTLESRLLISTNPRATTQYKRELMRLFLQNNVLPNIKIIQKKIENKSLNESDMLHVNK